MAELPVSSRFCLWYSVTGAGYDSALITMDKNPNIRLITERYSARWAIDVTAEDARQLFGAGSAAAAGRAVPFMLACQAIAVGWYATAGHSPAGIEARRANAPWYAGKTGPSTAGMTAGLRRVIIAAKFKPVRPDQPQPGEIHATRLTWEGAEDLAA